MSKLAVLIANSEYKHLNNLNACKNDFDLFSKCIDVSAEFDDVLQVLDGTSSSITNQIIEFVEKHKQKTVEQIVFYFSGHGARDNEEFYFACTDTHLNRINSTSISNQEIDGYLRELNPKVAVKFVDACHSGEHYIKSSDDFFKIIKNENSFDDLYFLFSSKSDEYSLVDGDYSAFTKLIFEAIYEHDSEKIRYKDILNYVTDVAESRLKHTPYQVSQGANTAYFFNTSLPKIKEMLSQEYFQKQEELEEEKCEKSTTLIEKIKEDAIDYCSEEEGLKAIESCISAIKNFKELDDINELFTIEIQDHSFIPYNSKSIGSWIKKNPDKNIFARPKYRKEKHTEEKYVKVPKNPNRINTLFGPSLKSLFESRSEYELREVDVFYDKVDGVEYLVDIDVSNVSIKFVPKEDFNNINQYSANLCVLFSKKYLYLFRSIEMLEPINWCTYSSPKCKNWTSRTLSLKNFDDKVILSLMNDIQNEILDDIKKQLNIEI